MAANSRIQQEINQIRRIPRAFTLTEQDQMHHDNQRAYNPHRHTRYSIENLPETLCTIRNSLEYHTHTLRDRTEALEKQKTHTSNLEDIIREKTNRLGEANARLREIDDVLGGRSIEQVVADEHAASSALAQFETQMESIPGLTKENFSEFIQVLGKEINESKQDTLLLAEIEKTKNYLANLEDKQNTLKRQRN